MDRLLIELNQLLHDVLSEDGTSVRTSDAGPAQPVVAESVFLDNSAKANSSIDETLIKINSTLSKAFTGASLNVHA